MAHFSDEAWADFARGIAHCETSSAIQKHLLEECAQCVRASQSWSKIHSVAATESSYVVPEDTVRMIKLQFEVTHRQQTQDYALGSLVFDSFTQPAIAGIRSGEVSARQVVYEAEGLTVDMRFDRQARSSRVLVVGQVLAKGASEPSWNDATVILWTEKGEPILAVKTTTFGEFQLEFEPQNHLRLSIERSGYRPVRIPLANLKESDY
jgi:acyl-coenzyme A thioesterase PaaI-like protein